MQLHRVEPGLKVILSKCDPNDTSGYKGDKTDALVEIAKLVRKLDSLQETLYAEHKHKVLIVLQAMDTGGKDGTVRHVFSGINPSGVRVASFKQPTPEELDHDYLWRIHQMVPGKGEMVIFNRSHYEDVLIVRVHGLVPRKDWELRYDQINEFEKYLTQNGMTILKFYLHIDKDEQKERLKARLDDSSKHWKFSLADLQERKLWPDYMQAYQDVLNLTSTSWAPWYVVPANHKWYRDLVISTVLVQTLEDLKMKFPQTNVDLADVTVK
jgi:PPK2 family polyphosphate:nucleotide phosphotransferase